MYLMTLDPLSRERSSSLVGVGSDDTEGQRNFFASGWIVIGAAADVVKTANKATKWALR